MRWISSSKIQLSPRQCRHALLAAIAGGCILAGGASASQAFTALRENSGSPHPLILPFHIGTPGNTHAPTTAGSGRITPASSAFSPRMTFNMMGWPWLKQKRAGSQASQQQINQDLLDVLKGMSTSARRLKAADAGAETQEVQKEIIARLDQLIKIAEKSQGKSGGQQKKQSQQQQSMSMQQSNGSNTSPMTPSQSATHSFIPGGGVMNPGDVKQFTSNKRQWGNLPPRARNMILNALRHQSLPQYKALVQHYYESLAKLNQTK
jgi:hypothetical protein